MSREWVPGDVAMVTIPGQPERQMTRYETSLESGWYSGAGANTEGKAHYSDTLSGRGAVVRPLVVIDPEDLEQVIDLCAALGSADAFRAAHTENVQTALRSLVTPPKPDEPTGLGAVVEDAKGLRYVLAPEGAGDNYPWTCADRDGGGFFRYADIAAVKVLSEGVTP